jgi:hypothetical protein
MFFRTSKLSSIKLGANHHRGKGIQNCSKNGQVLFKGEIITIMQKRWVRLKIFSKKLRFK